MFFRRQSNPVRKPVAGTSSRRPTSFRPTLEALERRDVPSAASYADSLQAWGTGAGVAGPNEFSYDMRGALAGPLPGSFSTHILYNGVLGRGTNAIAGGTLSASVSGYHVPAGTLQLRLTGGSIQWGSGASAGTVTITLSITGGTGACAGDTGTATFRGTMDRASETLSGSLTLSLAHGTPPPVNPPPSGSTSYTETLDATGTDAGIAGRDTFFYDTRGTLAGKLPGTFSSRIYYTGALGSGINPISSGSWSAAITGSSGTAGTLQGSIAGGSIRWSSWGQPGAVTVNFIVTGGTGPYAGDTGTGTFQGTIDWYTEALAGTLTLTLTHHG